MAAISNGNRGRAADSLLSLRHSIIAAEPYVLSEDSKPETSTIDLAIAKYVYFGKAEQQILFALDSPTRFLSSGKPVSLRSVVFAWQKKDVAIPDYIAAVQKLNADLLGPNGAGDSVQNLVFIEKLDLVTWLEGAADDSEHIAGLPEELAIAAGVQASVSAGAAAIGGVGPGAAVGSAQGALIASGGVRSTKVLDPRLAEIYSKERKMGDHNSVLRGIKPTDFSHVRKHADTFLGRSRSRPGVPPTIRSTAITSSPALVSNLKKPTRRPEPIILLSPSASSLLRMSNIKSFLESGVYVPADGSGIGSSTGANILQLARSLPTIEASRPLRFIIVDTPDNFKPDYWGRVVAVFTTGQLWQFKSYRWTQPAELFSHALGIHVGWRGEEVPASVKGWGRGVLSVAVDKWNSHQGANGRWRDREVVEQVWTSIEESMRSKGWRKDSSMARR